MNQTKAFLRNNKYEIIAFFVNVLTALFAFILINATAAFVVTISVFTLSIFIVIYFKTQDKDFYFLPLNKPGCDIDWVGRGTFKFTKNESCYEITNSDVGFIYPKVALWDDYYFECDFKIIKTSLGFIFRAQNLSNSVMIQIFKNKIKSHLRVNGNWIIYGEENINSNIDTDHWYKLKAYCEKRKIRINIFNSQDELVDRHITIPDTMTVIVKQPDDKDNKDKEEIRQILNIDFDFGAIGVRNSGNESALIKNIFIEKL